MIPNLQILRAIAALMVVFHHALDGTAHAGKAADSLGALQAIGQAGVDIFFVLSGFVMVVSTARTPRGPLDFLRGRLLRIAPLYVALTLLMALLIVVGGKTSGADILGPLGASLLFLAQPLTGQYPVLFLGWTLEYEMLFYALFALGLASGWRHGPLVVPTLAIGALCLAFPVLIALEFIAGMLVGHAFLRSPKGRPSALAWLALGVAGLVLAQVMGATTQVRWFAWGLPATLIVLGAAIGPQLHARWLVFLGDASYSIYLVQAFTIGLSLVALDRLLPAAGGEVRILLVLLVTTAAGALTHLLLERPLTRTLQRRLAGRRPASPVIAPQTPS